MKERNAGIPRLKRGHKRLIAKNLEITFDRVGKAKFAVWVVNAKGEPVIPIQSIYAKSVNGVIKINILDLNPSTHGAIFFKAGIHTAHVEVDSVDGESTIAKEVWEGNFHLSENQATLWAMNMLSRRNELYYKGLKRAYESIKRQNPQAVQTAPIPPSFRELFVIDNSPPPNTIPMPPAASGQKEKDEFGEPLQERRERNSERRGIFSWLL